MRKAGCEVKSYQQDHFRMTRFGPDTAVITYRAEQDTTCGAAKVPSPALGDLGAVRRDGRWQNALYVE